MWFPEKQPDADGLYRYEVPESEEEELARLRGEVSELRAALAESFAIWLYYGDQSRADIWEILPPHIRDHYRRQARERFNDDLVAYLSNAAARPSD